MAIYDVAFGFSDNDNIYFSNSSFLTNIMIYPGFFLLGFIIISSQLFIKSELLLTDKYINNIYPRGTRNLVETVIKLALYNLYKITYSYNNLKSYLKLLTILAKCIILNV